MQIVMELCRICSTLYSRLSGLHLSLHILCVFAVLWSVCYVFSAHLSISMRKNMRTPGLIFMKFDIGKVFKELSLHFSFHLN